MKGNPENFSQNGNLPLTNTDLTIKQPNWSKGDRLQTNKQRDKHHIT